MAGPIKKIKRLRKKAQQQYVRMLTNLTNGDLEKAEERKQKILGYSLKIKKNRDKI